MKKRTVLSTLMAILAITLMFFAVGCELPTPHVHTYSKDWSYDETYHWHAATCSHNEVSDKAMHEWDVGEITKEPSETEKGVKTYTCSTCKQTKTEDIDVTEKTCKFMAERKTLSQAGSAYGGYVTNQDGEFITSEELNIKAGSKFTVISNCNNGYMFLGWYNSEDDSLLSKENTYTFTIEKDTTIYALYQREKDIVELKLDAAICGFTMKNGKPTKTITSKGSKDQPYPDSVTVYGIQANGEEEYFGNSSNFDDDIFYDNGGFDLSKTGTYTITYTYKRDRSITASLEVEVVDTDYYFYVGNANGNISFYYNNHGPLNSRTTYYEARLPKGKSVTLTADAKDGYAFLGWYDKKESGNLISKDIVYTFTMPAKDTILYGYYTTSNKYYQINADVGGELVDNFGNELVGRIDEEKTYIPSSGIELNCFGVRINEGFEFSGWYDYTDENNPKKISDEQKLKYKVTETTIIKACFEENIKSIEIEKKTLDKEGFIKDTLYYAIGDEVPLYKEYTVNRKGIATARPLSAEEFTIDDSEVDFTKAGTYTVTYTYKKDTSIKTSLTFRVVDLSTAKIEYKKAASYLLHEYNGKAVFVSPHDITIDGISLYLFKPSSKIWKSISYKWIDTVTEKEVDCTDADVTLNGKIVTDFGPENDKRTIGLEFSGPIEAGKYRFEFFFNDTNIFTENAEITTAAFKKITSKEEFITADSSTWVNYKLYYYTIVGVGADGKYYVMQMPSIGSDATEAEARMVTPDENGNLILGDGRDFAFVNVNYYAGQNTDYTEFLTGYYGSYVIYSSSNSTSGSFGTPYIYRTGYTSVSGGNIYREYGTKSEYGNITVFAENGAVTIYQGAAESSNVRLRLVKDGDKYVFTSKPADEDTRESYDVFIYQSILGNN